MELLILWLEMDIAKMKPIMLTATMMGVTVVYLAIQAQINVHNAYVTPMESSPRLVILTKITRTTWTCIGLFKFLLDKLSKSTLSVLMLNPIQAAGKYAFSFVSMKGRRNHMKHAFSKSISVMIL